MRVLQRSTERLLQGLRARVTALRERNDEGQALIMALIIVLMMGLLPVAILSSLDQEQPYASASIDYESALAAAEAGVQEYANLMDQYPGYFDFAPQACPTGATSTNDPGLPGGSNLALGCWNTIAGTTPLEAFTYYPDTSDLSGVQSTANPFGGDVLLVVTGRAGTGKGTQYRRVEAAFTLSGVLTDVYFSNFEQPAASDLDQWQNTYQGGNLVTSGSHEFDEATTDTPAGYATSSGATFVPMATALCQYDADQVNTFIDWYSANKSPIDPPSGYPNQGVAYGPSNPYYGPWYGTFPDLGSAGYQFGTGTTGNQSACNVNYWISGDTFNGPVYSQDELTTCGSPAFIGSAPNLTTEVPPNFPFPASATTGWPGAKPPVAATPPATGYVSYPYGYNWNPLNWCGQGGAPSFADSGSPHLGVSQSLPSANQGLLSEIESGQVAGCVYTGPTMIRFSYNTSTQAETMYVWSPLTKDTYGVNGLGVASPNNVNCGAVSTTGFNDLCGGTACTGSNTEVSGSGAGTVVDAQTSSGVFAQVPVTTNLVIAVQNLPTASTDPNSWSTTPAAESNAVISGCIDPWVNPDSAGGSTSTTCTEGDAILSGAVSYQTTLSASNDIVVSRSLVYGCAVNGSGTYQSNLTSCQSSPDVLGLIALNNIWMARPYNTTTQQMPPTCTDDTDLAAPATVTYPGYTGAASWWNNMVPNCLVHNPTIDAATAALTGFFEVEYWREGNPSGGTISFNGSDAVNNAGQFGTFSGSTLNSGYLLTLNYDSRLKADSPPQYLPATDGVWTEAGWVTCSSTTPNPNTSGYPTSSVPACVTLPHSYAP